MTEINFLTNLAARRRAEKDHRDSIHSRILSEASHLFTGAIYIITKCVYIARMYPPTRAPEQFRFLRIPNKTCFVRASPTRDFLTTKEKTRVSSPSVLFRCLPHAHLWCTCVRACMPRQFLVWLKKKTQWCTLCNLYVSHAYTRSRKLNMRETRDARIQLTVSTDLIWPATIYYPCKRMHV